MLGSWGCLVRSTSHDRGARFVAHWASPTPPGPGKSKRTTRRTASGGGFLEMMEARPVEKQPG